MEARILEGFSKQYGLHFRRPELLRLALTHRSYLTVGGPDVRESNERLEFLGDSVLGLVSSEFLYRERPTEHEGQLTKTKSLLVSKAILSRRSLAMGLGKFVLMSHSESESGGRQRLSILADAFEAVVGAIYLDLGYDAARDFIIRWLLRDAREIAADKRHANYKSHLQEYVQSTFRTHPVYRIRSEMGPDHSKQFNVEVMVGRRVIGTGRGRNKKEAEQAAARNALEQVETRSKSDQLPERRPRDPERSARARDAGAPVAPPPGRPEVVSEGEREAAVGDASPDDRGEAGRRRRGRRGGRGRRGRPEEPGGRRDAAKEPEGAERRPAPPPAQARPALPERLPPPQPVRELEPLPAADEDDLEEIGRPEGMTEERRVDPFDWGRESRSESAGSRPVPGAFSGAAEPMTGGRAVGRLGSVERLEPHEPAEESAETTETTGEPDPYRPDAKSERPSSPGRPPSYGRRPGRSRR